MRNELIGVGDAAHKLGFSGKPLACAIAAILSPTNTTFASLFANNSELAINFSDTSTLYQESTGENQADAVNDTLGFVIDQSLGGESGLGAEELTNGGFDSDTAWTKDAGWSITGGRAVHTGGGDYIKQGSISAGSFYKIEIDVAVADGSNFVQIYLGNSPAVKGITSPGQYVLYGVAQTDTLGYALRGIGDTEINSVSIKKLPGYHLRQATGTARPLLKQDGSGTSYAQFDLGDDALAGTLGTFTGQVAIASIHGLWIYDIDQNGAWSIGGTGDSYTGGPGNILTVLANGDSVLGVYGIVAIDGTFTAAQIAGMLTIWPGCAGEIVISGQSLNDGGFDDTEQWFASANWTIADSKAASDGATGYLQNSATIETSAIYILEVEITAYTSGFLQAYSGNVLMPAPSRYPQSTGVHGIVGVTNATYMRFRSDTFLGEIDNAVAKKVTLP